MLKFSKLASVATSNETAYTENGINQTTALMYTCYNMANATRMIDAEIKVWTTRTGRRTASNMPKLCTLSPTTEAFRKMENVLIPSVSSGEEPFTIPQTLNQMGVVQLTMKKQDFISLSHLHPQGSEC